MKRNWQVDELIEHWTLLPDELALLVNKTNPNRLGFALLLNFFQLEARFPHDKHEVPKVVVFQIAQQRGTARSDWGGFLCRSNVQVSGDDALAGN